MKKILLAILFVSLSAKLVHADTSTRPFPEEISVCPGLPGTPDLCWWKPDSPPSWYNPAQWSDSLGLRGSWCDGNPQTGEVEVIDTTGVYCTKIHGIQATDPPTPNYAPAGFWFDWHYVRFAGWYGFAPPSYAYQIVQIGSYRLGPNTHVTFCQSDLLGTFNDPCRGQVQQYVLGGITATSGTVSITTYGMTVGINAALPPNCPGGAQKFVECPTAHSATGLRIVVAGDGLVRNGSYDVGNPVTGPGGAPCYGSDPTTGTKAIFEYPVQGTANADGSLKTLCP